MHEVHPPCNDFLQIGRCLAYDEVEPRIERQWPDCNWIASEITYAQFVAVEIETPFARKVSGMICAVVSILRAYRQLQTHLRRVKPWNRSPAAQALSTKTSQARRNNPPVAERRIEDNHTCHNRVWRACDVEVQPVPSRAQGYAHL